MISTPLDVAAGLVDYVIDNPGSSAVLAVLGLVGLALAFLLLRLLWRVVSWLWTRYVATRPVEDILTIVAASIATGVSAQGMWRFSGDVLGFDGPLQLLLFAFIEVAMVTSAVRARRSMRENGRAGVDGLAVWAMTGLSAVLSSMDARSLPEAVFRLAAPIVAAWLWERSMAIERQRLTGRTRINWRLTPERLFVALSLAETNDRTATEVDTHRRLTRVALAAKKARALREAGASPRKQRNALARLDRAMDRAVEHTGLVQDPARQEQMLAQIAALYNTAKLTEIQPVPFWHHLAEERAEREERERKGAEAMAVLRDFSGRRVLLPAHASASAGVNGVGGDTPRDTVNGTPRGTGGGTPNGAAGTPRDTAGGTPNGASGGTVPTPAPRPRQPVTRPPRNVSRKPNGSRHGTAAQPSKEELTRRIAWLHDLVKTQPDLSVTDLRDKAVKEYSVSPRTAYRYIEQAGLAPRDTTGGDTAGDTPRDTDRDTTGDTPPDTA